MSETIVTIDTTGELLGCPRPVGFSMRSNTASSGANFQDATTATKKLRPVLSGAVGNNSLVVENTAARAYKLRDTEGDIGIFSAGGYILASGLYTPILTANTNIFASTPYQCQYMRVGSVVTVSGMLAVDPTIVGQTVLEISLPIASNLGANEDCNGTAHNHVTAGEGAAIYGSVANDRAVMSWTTADAANHLMMFIFTYRII